MEWSKIKNIILLILLVLNGILLVMALQQELEQRQDASASLTQVLQALEKNGITVSRSILPEEKELPTLLVEQENLQTPPKQAQALLGHCSWEDEGGSVRLVYTGAAGRLETFSNGRFSAEFNPGEMMLNGQEPLVHGLAKLSCLEFSGELTDRRSSGEEEILTFRQNLDGVPVFNAVAELHYQNGGLHTMEGQRIFGEVSVLKESDMLNVPTMLMRFLGQRNESGRMFSQIYSITAGYHLSNSRPYTLTPVWYVETDSGSYMLNGSDGKML